jgi:cytidylate kinase
MTEFVDRNIIVFEGLGGAGKTTAAQILADRYGYSNFNTGTLFRATAAAILLEGVQQNDIESFVQDASYDVELSRLHQPHVAVGGRDVSELLQYPEVTKVSSVIGSIPTAANRLETIFHQSLQKGNMVVEGKNLADRLGETATYMFFFIADVKVRAYRKWNQARLLGRTHYTLLEAQLDTLANDRRDQKMLVAPPNMKIIDTTLLSPNQVVAEIARHAQLD